MATEDEYIWRYDLVDYNLTKNVNNDHVAKVNTGKSMTMDKIANGIVSDGTDLKKETLVAAESLISKKIKQYLCQGHTVVIGCATFQPVITGTFTGSSGAFDTEKNACTISVSPSQSLREEVAKVSPEFSGTVLTTGGAKIDLVTDAITGSTNGTITPGGGLTVTGTKIRCVNEDGSDIGSVSFLDAETYEVAASVTYLIANNPSTLIFVCPALSAGSYILRIETYYTNSSTFLKTVRQIDSEVLTVAGAETTSTDTTEDSSESE